MEAVLMILRFFDFEVTPNWWLCIIGDLNNEESVDESIKSSFVEINSDMPNARDLMIKMFRDDNYVLCGYNIKRYDLIIANAIYQGLDARQVKLVSDMIVTNECNTIEQQRVYPLTKTKMRGVCYQDLMDDNNGSLKEKESILGLNIIESSVPFDKEELTDDDKAEMTLYCKHDVFAAMYYYIKVMKGYVDNKLTIGRKFGIPEKECYMCTNAKLVAKALGAVRTHFADADKVEIFLPEKIKKYCYDNLPAELIDKIRNSTESFDVKLFDNVVSFGNGGIHSTYKNNLYVESDSEWTLMNIDAASYYPSMLIQFECLSRAVKNPLVFKEIFDERIYLKHKKDKTQEEEDSQLANKLVLNTTFGASGNKYLDLYDPYMCTRCCRLGQIFLAALANRLTNKVPGLKIIQTNTDGILAYFKRSDMDLVSSLKNEWTNVSGINMDEDPVEKIWQRDVNNYLLVKANGSVKRKGLWLMDTWTKPGYFLISPLTAYVCQKAAIDFLTKDKDIIQSIISNNEILDFMITCKKGPSFSKVVQRFENGMEDELFNCNRVIAGKDSRYGTLYKIKKVKGKLSYHRIPNIPDYCKLMNEDLSTYNFNDIKKDIDYMYYINRCFDLLDIEWLQLCGDICHRTNRFDLNYGE